MPNTNNHELTLSESSDNFIKSQTMNLFFHSYSTEGKAPELFDRIRDGYTDLPSLFISLSITDQYQSTPHDDLGEMIVTEYLRVKFIVMECLCKHKAPISTEYDLKRQQQLSEQERFADNGHTEAQYDLGMNHLHGINGATKCLSTAHKWLDMAAGQNHVDALIHLARMYESSEDQESRKLVMAMRIKAAKLGSAEAQYWLSTYYSNECDYKIAIHWLALAAEQDHIDAQIDIAQVFNLGMWSERQDKAKALYWFERAAAQGSQLGRGEAIRIKRTIKDKD